MSKAEWLSSYQKYGYLALPNILDVDELQEIAVATDRLASEAATLRESNRWFALEVVDDAACFALLRDWIAANHDLWYEDIGEE